jgi:hypothetical protein
MEAAAMILLWLAEGAITYLGGKALATIMDDPQIKDVEDLIRAAITEINVYTRQAIQENEIKKLSGSLNAVIDNLKDFAVLKSAHDKEVNRFLLTDAIIKTEESIAQCVLLGIPAIFCYVNAVSRNPYQCVQATHRKCHNPCKTIP